MNRTLECLPSIALKMENRAFRLFKPPSAVFPVNQAPRRGYDPSYTLALYAGMRHVVDAAAGECKED